MQTNKDLIKELTEIRTKIVKAFEDKQEIDFGVDSVGLNEHYFWNDVYTFSFDDIVIDLNTNQKAGFIKEWYSDCRTKCIDINYNSYCMGLRPRDLKSKE